MHMFKIIFASFILLCSTSVFATNRLEDNPPSTAGMYESINALIASAIAQTPLSSPAVQNALRNLRESNAVTTAYDLIKEHRAAFCSCSTGCCYFGFNGYACAACVCGTCIYLHWYISSLDRDTENFGMVPGRTNHLKMH